VAGRSRQELAVTSRRAPGARSLRTIITIGDARKKPHADGLRMLLDGRDPATALYLADNMDDALAARDAGVPFLAIIARDEHRFRERAARFQIGRASCRERGGRCEGSTSVTDTARAGYARLAEI